MEPVDVPAVPVWPDNWRAVLLFFELRRQWRVGPGGPIALDRGAFPASCQPGMRGRRGREMLLSLEVMESEALCWFEEQRGKP